MFDAILARQAAAGPGETSSRSPAWPVSGTRTGSGCRGDGIARVRNCIAIRAHPYASSAETSYFAARLGRQTIASKGCHSMPGATALRERLDARQAQICGSGASGGSGPRRSRAALYGVAPAVRSRGENQATLPSACQCGMPLCRPTFCHLDAMIAGLYGRPYASRQPSRTLHAVQCILSHVSIYDKGHWTNPLRGSRVTWTTVFQSCRIRGDLDRASMASYSAKVTRA